jgi:hypothetical protein
LFYSFVPLKVFIIPIKIEFSKLFLFDPAKRNVINEPGNTTGGSITVLLTSCLTGLDWSIWQIKTKIVSCHTANSKPVKQEVNSTVILSPFVFPE